MARSEPRLLSAPHRVLFCGFESSTPKLQQAGWQLSVNYSEYGHRMQLAMQNKEFGGYMIADSLEHDRFRPMDPGERLTFVVRRVNADVLIYRGDYGMSFAEFEPIDARPQYVTTERKSIKDFNIFASQLVRTEEIIVEPKDVAECLELIRKMQAPELQAIRERNATRDFMQPSNQTQFHAQIMSLAA